MTIKNSWGKTISAAGFAGAGVFCFLSRICAAFAVNSWGTFWSSCSGIFNELITIMLFAALAGYVLIYLSGKETFDLIICAGIAASMCLHIVSNNSSYIVWTILGGICATAYLGIMALRAKDEDKMILVILLGCAALYSILGVWLVRLIFFRGYSAGLFAFGFVLMGIFGAASYAIAGVHIYTSDTIESALSAAETANTASSTSDSETD